jgi:hypothetical protein
MNTCWADHVSLSLPSRLSVLMIQLENCRAVLDKIWYERYAIVIYSKIIILNFLQSVIPTRRTNDRVRWIGTSATYSRVLLWCKEKDFQEVHDFGTVILCFRSITTCPVKAAAVQWDVSKNIATWRLHETKEYWLDQDPIPWSHAYEPCSLPQNQFELCCTVIDLQHLQKTLGTHDVA